MKITPINFVKTTSFKGDNKILNRKSNTKKLEIDTWDLQMFGLTSCITAFPSADYVKNGFKQANTIGKIRHIAGGIGMTLGLALMLMPLWKFLRKINSDI